MAVVLKTPEQIEGIRKSSKLAGRALKYLGQEVIRPGITTAYIDQKVMEFCRDHGAIPATLGYKGYPAASCISVNDVVCHGIPGKYELRDGDIVNVDVTTILNGYYGDTCTMYEIGEVSPEAKRIVQVAKECLVKGIEQCLPGNFLGNVGYAITRHAQGAGFSVVYQFCGHGIGLKFHEEPEVSHNEPKNSGIKLKPGMTFTVEPMINEGKARVKVDKADGWTARTIDGKLSAQFEHTILITPTGHEVLTDVDNEYPIS